LDAEPIYQSFPESPAIHVAVLADVDPGAFRWIRFGAEEEGVPCREAPVQAESRAQGAGDPVAAAYAAAQASRLGVGVAVGGSGLYLHEAHMPAEHPVWEAPLGGDVRQVCRLAGCNAGRLVKRMPLRFDLEKAPLTTVESPAIGGGSEVASAAPLGQVSTLHETEVEAPAVELAAIIASIVRSLQGRGIYD
jgi:Dehydratase medium subunit